jgi:Holliday junction resolvase-like predicted endonuclease
MPEREEFIFSLINEVVKDFTNPYMSESGTRFLFRKDNCLLILNFEYSGVSIEGSVLRGGLYLEADKLSSFCARLKELRYIPMFVNIEVFFTTRRVYSVFPRAKVGFDRDVRHALREIKTVLRTLTLMERIIEEYRVFDKSAESMKTLWRQVGTDTTKYGKGRKLEELLSIMINLSDDFHIVKRNVRTKSEEIDLVVENVGRSTFFSQLRSPLMLVECKNWTSKVDAKEVRDFAQKLQNRSKMLCNVGILVAVSGLTRDANEELLGYRGKDFLIVTIDGEDISKIITSQMRFEEFLKDKISKAALR